MIKSTTTRLSTRLKTNNSSTQFAFKCRRFFCSNNINRISSISSSSKDQEKEEEVSQDVITPTRYRTLYSALSEYNNKVVVTEDISGKFRNLSFGGTPATSLLQGKVGLWPNDSFDFRSRCGYIDTMATAAIAYLKALQQSLSSSSSSSTHLNHFFKDYSHLLFVGLGVGSLPNFFVRHFPTMDVEVVEIDPVVAQVSVEYFGLPAKKLRLHVKDVKNYLENDAKNSSGKNIIFLDIFNEGGLPKGVFNQTFVQQLRNLLRSQGGGLLVANIFCNIKTFNLILELWKSVFKTVHLLAVEENRNNIIIVAYDSDPIPIEKVIDTAAKITDYHEFDYDFLKVLQFGIAEGIYDPTL